MCSRCGRSATRPQEPRVGVESRPWVPRPLSCDRPTTEPPPVGSTHRHDIGRDQAGRGGRDHWWEAHRSADGSSGHRGAEGWGMVTIFLSSDSVVRSLNVDVPEQFLSQEPRFFAEWLKQVDVFITLPSASNIKALDAGVPATRLGKLNQAGQFLTPLLDDMKFREVDITYPTRER